MAKLLISIGGVLVTENGKRVDNYDEVKNEAEIATQELLQAGGYEPMLPTRLPGQSFHGWNYS